MARPGRQLTLLRYIAYTESGGESWTYDSCTRPVTPLIQLCRVISSGMEEPSCVQSSLTFYGLLPDVYLGWYLCPTVFPLQCYAVNTISSIHNFFPRPLTIPLARVYQHASVLSTEISLTSYRRRAKPSPRAMAPSPSEKNSYLVNLRWRKYVG